MNDAAIKKGAGTFLDAILINLWVGNVLVETQITVLVRI